MKTVDVDDCIKDSVISRVQRSPEGAMCKSNRTRTVVNRPLLLNDLRAKQQDLSVIDL